MGAKQSNIEDEESTEKVQTSPPKIPRLYMSMVRKRTLTVSVYDYPEHLNPFREEEEIERRAALAALEGRTSRCHLLPMSPYATLGRSSKSNIDLSPTSSESSTPVNGTLRRRMKRRAPLPPSLTAVTPTSTPLISRHEASPTERSRPATPPSAMSTPEATTPTHAAQPPSDVVKSPSSQESSALSCSLSEEKDTTTVAKDPDDHVEMARDENECITDTETTLPREHDPPEALEENSSETAANVEMVTQEEKEEIERLKTERPDEQVINNKETLSCEIINLDVENNNSNNSSLEKNESDINEIESKSELLIIKESESITNDDEKINTSILNKEVENKEIIVNESRSYDKDEAFQDDTIEDDNIKTSDIKEENIIEKSVIPTNDTLPYIDQDPTSNIPSNDEETTIISNGHCTNDEDEGTQNGHKEVMEPQTSNDLAPSPLPRRSKSPKNSTENSLTKNSTKSSQDKYTTQVSHFEIKITDITDV